MAASMKKTETSDRTNVESQQLLYSDAFGKCYQEERLKIVGRPKTVEQLQTFAVPQSSVMSQIKSFLPRLSDSNQKMVQEIQSHPEMAEKINMECLNDKGKHIEMNLSLIPSLNEDAGNESDEQESSDDSQDMSSDDGVSSDDDNKDEDGNKDDRLTDATLSLKSAEGIKENNLPKLKLSVSTNKKGSKQKPIIEEMDNLPDGFNEESANR